MSFSIRLTPEEKILAESYAKLHSLSLGEAFKKALFERIEDEYDITAAKPLKRRFLNVLKMNMILPQQMKLMKNM